MVDLVLHAWHHQFNAGRRFLSGFWSVCPLYYHPPSSKVKVTTLCDSDMKSVSLERPSYSSVLSFQIVLGCCHKLVSSSRHVIPLTITDESRCHGDILITRFDDHPQGVFADPEHCIRVLRPLPSLSNTSGSLFFCEPPHPLTPSAAAGQNISVVPASFCPSPCAVGGDNAGINHHVMAPQTDPKESGLDGLYIRKRLDI